MGRSGSRRLRVRKDKRRRASPLELLQRLPEVLLARLDGRKPSRRRRSSRRSHGSQPSPVAAKPGLEPSSGKRRSRRRGPRWLSPLLRLRRLVLLPLMELLETLATLTAPLWRRPFISVPLGLLGMWLAWPLLAPGLLPLLGLTPGSDAQKGPPPQVISVFVEDPTRSIWALDLWKNKPGAWLVMQGRPSSQIANVNYLRSQGLWPEKQTRLVTLEPGCDTVGQVAALARFLQQQPRPGQLTMVTSNAHLPRTLAIARTVIGPMGWTVDGLPVVTQDNRPESPLRLVRDQLRAQMLRFTGISGSRSDETCE